jgi:hypothetical protein
MVAASKGINWNRAAYAVKFRPWNQDAVLSISRASTAAEWNNLESCSICGKIPALESGRRFPEFRRDRRRGISAGRVSSATERNNLE